MTEPRALAHGCLDIGHSLVIGHWKLVIGDGSLLIDMPRRAARRLHSHRSHIVNPTRWAGRLLRKVSAWTEQIGVQGHVAELLLRLRGPSGLDVFDHFQIGNASRDAGAIGDGALQLLVLIPQGGVFGPDLLELLDGYAQLLVLGLELL